MKNVIIYTTQTCVYCKMAKEYFAKNNITYEDKNVAINDKAREEMRLKSSQLGVPVIEIDGEIIIGFDRRKIDNLLLL